MRSEVGKGYVRTTQELPYSTSPVLVKEPQKQSKMAGTVSICQNAMHLKLHFTYLPYDGA